MRIRAGYELRYSCPQPTPIILVLRTHPSRRADLLEPDAITFEPPAPSHDYSDGFGNLCTRVLAPAGELRIASRFTIADTGLADAVVPHARQHAVENLPDDVLVFLLGSRYCDTDRLSETAWSLFAGTPPGWARVQAICDYVHDRITFGYQHARATRTAWDGHQEGLGVCRDFAHLAITLCRCMNIPARYCTGYLGDIGVPIAPEPMDFSAWFEVYLGGAWHTFDARHNHPRIGRVLIARGRDATDVAIATTFGPATLVGFQVMTDEIANEAGPATSEVLGAQ